MNFKRWIESVETKVLAYHCGGQITGDFSTNHIGNGEGKQILGPGIYFASDERVANMYCKYASEPYMHTVKLDTSNFYDPIKGTPKLNPMLDNIAVEMGFKNSWDMYQNTKGVSSLNHGRGIIGSVVKALGNENAINMFVKHGIQGALEIINHEDGTTEFSVFDPSVITKVSSKQKNSS